MKKLVAFFKLLRWPNLIITALTMCLVYHCVMHMTYSITFTFLVIAMVLIQAGGYIINDIFDKDIDKVNKPEKMIVDKVFSVRQCKSFYIILTVIGLVCGLLANMVAVKRGQITLLAFLVLLVCLLYSYSKRYKKRLVIGNVIVSLSVASAVFLPWFFEVIHLIEGKDFEFDYAFLQSSLCLVLIYTAFAFIMTMIREIIKDMEDVEGDRTSNCRTMPIAWGMKTTKIITLILCVITFCGIQFAGSYINESMGLEVTSKILRWSSALLVFPISIGLVGGVYTPAFYSKMLKVSMLIGVLSMFFIK